MRQKSIFSFVLLLALLSKQSIAQVKKGDFLAGINLSAKGLTHYDTTGGSSRTVKPSLNPYFSYAVRNNITIGASVTLNSLNNGMFNFSKNKHDIAAAVFVRRYIPVGKKWYGYLQGDVTYKSEAGLSYFNEWYGYKQVGLNLSGGMGYNISSKVRIELGINNLAGVDLYRRTEFRNPQSGFYENKTVSFNAGNFFHDNGLHLGISFRF
jgi:hypothetical protein